jgi:hypothetical protein
MIISRWRLVTADGSSVTVKSADLMVSAAEERAESLTENRLRLHRIPSIDGREPCKRTLIHFPIIHTQADMGELSEPIQRLKLKRLGQKRWERSVDVVDKLWTRLNRA